jgi:hypothetical protein
MLEVHGFPLSTADWWRVAAGGAGGAGTFSGGGGGGGSSYTGDAANTSGITVAGIKNGAAYDAPGPATITCTATEMISGLAGPCTLRVTRRETAISWTATATSKAGVTASVAGQAGLTDFYVAAAKLADGRFVVTEGKPFTIEAYVLGAIKAPRYVYATPQGVKPAKLGPAMKKTAPNLWALRVTVTTSLTHKSGNWTIGILVGHTLHTIPIHLQRLSLVT